MTIIGLSMPRMTVRKRIYLRTRDQMTVRNLMLILILRRAMASGGTRAGNFNANGLTMELMVM